MPGSLKVFIVDDYDTLVFYGPYGAWSVDGGAWQTSGAVVTGLSDGPHTVTFEAVFPPPSKTPVPQIVEITDGMTTITSGTYAYLQPETILETGVDGLKERPLKELDTILSTPLFFAASSMDASFSGFPGNPYNPLQAPGFAYEAAAVIGAYFDQGYDIMLEGGQEACDMISQSELEAIAALVEPYLTPLGESLPGGVPIVVGYQLNQRNVDSWIIQRGKGFSLITAINAGYIAGITQVMYSWEEIGSTQMQPQTVAGFAVAFNVVTWPTQAPTGWQGAPINGMPTPLPGGFPMVSGYPASGGANISQPTNILGSVALHTINDDGTINAALNWSTTWGSYLTGGFNVDYTSGSGGGWNFVYAAEGFTDWYNILLETHLAPYGLAWSDGMGPQYYDGSPDWTWTFYGPSGTTIIKWTLTWNGTNKQTNNRPLFAIFWLGLLPSEVPQITFTGPNDQVVLISTGFPTPGWMAPSSPRPYDEPLDTLNQCSPVDRNARITTTTNGTVSPFDISLTNPPSASSWQLFNLQ